MDKKNYLKNKNYTLLAFFTLILLLGSFLPINSKKVEAFWFATWATDVSTAATAATSVANTGTNLINTSISIKNVAKDVLKEVAKNVARRALAEMTKSTINWINSGFHGSPLFLENSDSFFKDIAKSEIKNFIDMTGYNNLRFPFGKTFALNTIGAYKQQLGNNLEYSLSRVINDPVLLHNYRTDFNVGGWNGFLINTQYPQNNYVGYQMLASEELARRLAGTTQSAAEKVATTLEQGQGFLSPQTCPSNPLYNNTKNQFQQPRWNESEYARNNPPPEIQDYEDEYAYNEAIEQWNIDLDSARFKWESENGCPGGLVTTTPGSVVAGSINKALGVSQDQASLSAAMGNSISAIFDALLNKFIGDGLNALASKVNPKPSADSWDYYGNTLGTVSSYGSTAWDAGPDEVIILADFKNAVEQGIADTIAELQLIYNESPTNPGITQMFGNIWPKTRELDICLPGPDIRWEDRTTKEMERNSKALQEKITDDNAELSLKADLVLKELMFAVDFFKDWINNKMLTELPKSVIYMDAIDELDSLYYQADELTNARRLKTQALARLEAIKNGLDGISSQPEPGTPNEKIIIKLKQQYDATRETVANSYTVDSRQVELDVIKDKFNKLNELIPQCQQERVEKGWTNLGGRNSTYLNQGTEENLFCDFPVSRGYSHNSFIGPDSIIPKLPMVNGRNVLSWDRWGWFTGTRRVNIEMNCDVIYKANVLDYKRNLPGLTTISEDFEDLSRNPGGGGQCTTNTVGIYSGALRDAMNAVLAENVGGIADKDPRVDTGTGREYRANAIEFLRLTSEKLRSMGYQATEKVLNGNNRPSTGDIIAVWGANDTLMVRYDAINGNATVMRDAPMTRFEGFIPLNCTATGGGTDCKDKCLSNNPETPTTPTTNPTPGTAFIQSVSPSQAKPGVTTLTITGLELTNQISFFDGAGNRNTVVGTVNSAKTQTTVLVPADQAIGNATVKIYQGNQVWSNGKLIQVSGSGSTSSITTATPSSTWSPIQTANGWNPKISPDGKYVAYGFGANKIYIADLATNTERSFSNQDSNLGCFMMGWIRSDTYSFVCEVVDNGPTARYEVKVGEWIARKTADSTSLVRGNQHVAADGHWATYLAATRIVRDNVILTSGGTGGALSLGGTTTVHACSNSDDYKMCIWNGTTLSKEITVTAPLTETATKSGYILYGGGGNIRGRDPVGTDANKKIGTFSFEGKLVLFNVKGTIWIATSVESNTTNKSYIVLRPWNSKNAIVLDTGNQSSGSAGIDVAFDGTNFVVSQNTNQGVLKVMKVPENATRHQF